MNDRSSASLVFEERPSDSVFVERVWRARSERAGSFLSIAQNNFEMVVTRHQGRTFLTLRGPETKATIADCPAEGEWLGIRFALGTFMPQHMPADLSDRRDVNLPEATGHSFWLDGSAWDYPDFENAETFVKRLVAKGILSREPAVDGVLQGHQHAMSLRSVQRRFLRATGLSRSLVHQVERARHATNLLRQGAPILDAVFDAGYFDQPHLTRSLKHRIGLTPSEVADGHEQLSFLYKTTPRS